MSGFSADWLALRAAADGRARDVVLERELAGWLERPAAPQAGRAAQHRRDVGNDGVWGTDPARLPCVDLAAGTGANARRLAPRLPGPQHWRLVDADGALLSRAAALCAGLCDRDGRAVVVETVECDLAVAPLAALCAGAALVTASALLDLVSAAWLERLADAVTAAGAAGHFALDYDGRRECVPADPWDVRAHVAFDRHQRTTKSFGVALGPDAAALAARAFAARGYGVRRAASDWRLGPGDAELQRALLRGWAEAATALEPDAADEHADWLERRLAHVAAGRSQLHVGHEDLLVLPPAPQITRVGGGSPSG